MKPSAVSDNLQRNLREFVAQRTGLHFSQKRWADLQRGLTGAVREMGFTDLPTAAEWLLSAPLTKSQLDVLASHLTVGETYFFREKKTFAVLAQEILPEILRSRRNSDRRLRIWSAACCTGEEPYSLAILLQQVIPDLADWFVTILATDINTRFLQTAAAGIYGEWSFRETSADFKDCYFKRTEDGRYAILPQIKERVTFAQLNLVQDAFPSLVEETNAMDVIFCRNVLMYFSPEQVRRVIDNLRRALVPDGWLIVSPSEASHTLFSQFTLVNYPGVILYRNRPNASRQDGLSSVRSRDRQPLARSSQTLAEVFAEPDSADLHLVNDVHPDHNVEFSSAAESPTQRADYSNAADLLTPSRDAEAAAKAQTYSRLTRDLANQGKLTEALASCDRWIEAETLDHSAHYLRGIVLQELGEAEQARRSFQAAIYLQPQFVLAHFALGNLARSRDMAAQASKHFANALSFLHDYQSDATLPESDGLSAGRLREIIESVTAIEVLS